MAELKQKNIVVAGDLLVDHDLARLPVRGRGFHAPCSQTLLSHSYGGAWYVADLIDLALGGFPAEQSGYGPIIHSPERIYLGDEAVIQSLALGRAFAVWQLFEEGRDKVWRIGEFLGCQSPAEKARAVPVTSDPAAPDVLVLDDLGIGFASNPECWPAGLRAGGTPRSVVVKASASFDSLLWQRLLSAGMAEKVTVVTSAHALRAMGAKLSRALSWDQTVEDLIKEFTEGRSSLVFGGVKRVVVMFGTEGAAVFSRLPRGPREPGLSDRLHFERIVYDPVFLEGDWRGKHKGVTFGGHSVLTAAVVRHELQEEDFPLFIAICRALEGSRAIHELGAGSDIRNLNLKASAGKLRHIFAFPSEKEKSVKKGNHAALPEDNFRAAFPREILDPSTLPTDQLVNRCILTDVTGESCEFIAAKAEEIVIFGVEKALAAVPRAKYGAYITVDREEIERINSIRNLILDYRDGNDQRPLSIAVFGQPGSGKSFAIKQLADELFGRAAAVLEFNLSQFESVHDLHEALHQVRDKSLEGKIPFVFWDEFDSRFHDQSLGWLKEFLAPMQDAKFQANGVLHPLGRAIFVFAGGTRASFEDFAKEPLKGAQAAVETQDYALDMNAFKNAKTPDFLSRLRGYVNIKGPNLVTPEDNAYLIRRAMLLRSIIERYFGDSIVDPHSKKAEISPGVVNGLLRVEKYLHGARSMEAVVSMSHLRDSRSFGLADLPPKELLDLHLSVDFIKTAEEAEFVGGPLKHFVELLAEEQHEGFCRNRQADGYVYGPIRNDDAGNQPKTHPLLKPYVELDEAGKERNRIPARLALTRLALLGYKVVPAAMTVKGAVQSFTEKEKYNLSVSEHQRWTRERLVEGYIFGPLTNDLRRYHFDIQPFESLSEKDKHLDDNLIDAIWRVISKLGLVVVKTAG